MSSIFGSGFKEIKCKTALKMCLGRIKLLRNKKEIGLRGLKREIAELLRAGKEDSARIRVEAVIREQATMQAYDVLELFCELLSVRLPILARSKECPPDLQEAVASIIYAAPRCADLPELTTSRSQFGHKFGKEFVAAAQELRPGCAVNRVILEQLAIRAPAPEVKLAVLKDIADSNGIEWDFTATAYALKAQPSDLLDSRHYSQQPQYTPGQSRNSFTSAPPSSSGTVKATQGTQTASFEDPNTPPSYHHSTAAEPPPDKWSQQDEDMYNAFMKGQGGGAPNNLDTRMGSSQMGPSAPSSGPNEVPSPTDPASPGLHLPSPPSAGAVDNNTINNSRTPPAAGPPPADDDLPDFDQLAKRFEALKQKR
eukprot:jgi/Chlat1/5774/Chrsp387S05495